jgi:phosphopantothenoylcysteine synthetase/decarboxylase
MDKKSRKHFLITAGGTREYIDPVRFISNASSGRMGYALAEAAIKAGHKVTLVTTPTGLKFPAAAKIITVETGRQMLDAVKRYFNECDCLIMAAAVCDYAPARPAKTKIKKSGKNLTIVLKPTPDILKWAAGKSKGGQIVVGFALEDRGIRANAERKLIGKKLDMVVANTPAAIGGRYCKLQIKTSGDKWAVLPGMSKEKAAVQIIRMAEGLQKR